MLRALALLFIALSALVPGTARADGFLHGSFLLVDERGDGRYWLSAELPESVAAPEQLGLPDTCHTETTSTRREAGRLALDYRISCAEPLDAGAIITGNWGIDGARFVTIGPSGRFERVLTASDGAMVLPVGELVAAPRGAAELFRAFLWQGMLHIWLGWDHLAFVFILCLLARGRQLLWLVTAFTLGHSVTLVAAFLELISVPVPPVEAAIALSIMIMAREALLLGGTAPDASRHRRQMVIVAAFGLLHGLGFASALGELGILPQERLVALAAFNIGVELGQLAFVAAVALLAPLLRGLAVAPALRTASLVAVGLLGAWWMAERVAGFALA
ncbi:HupE/UreJ family protein [Thermaurantiacus tibetensis]|nr:HupE/UreJ family protein [Thermaurantiacus tibetensis]